MHVKKRDTFTELKPVHSCHLLAKLIHTMFFLLLWLLLLSPPFKHYLNNFLKAIFKVIYHIKVIYSSSHVRPKDSNRALL